MEERKAGHTRGKEVRKKGKDLLSANNLGTIFNLNLSSVSLNTFLADASQITTILSEKYK